MVMRGTQPITTGVNYKIKMSLRDKLFGEVPMEMSIKVQSKNTQRRNFSVN